MWNNPNEKAKTSEQQRRRERERVRKMIHIKRIMATVEVLNQESDAPKSLKQTVRLMLNDLSLSGAGLFSPIAHVPGSFIKLTIKEPTALEIKAKVIWSQDDPQGGRILAKDTFHYRIGIEFIVDEQEKAQLAKFCDDIAKNHLFTPKAI